MAWATTTAMSTASPWNYYKLGDMSTVGTINNDWTIGYYPVPSSLPIADVIGELMEVTYQSSMRKMKRISLFGKLVGKDSGDEEEQSILALKWIKGARKKLSKKEQKRYEARAEKAFKAAVKNLELGLKSVSSEFEKEMEKALRIVSPVLAGYESYITNKEIDEFRKHLPKNKELVIDELDEYDKLLPKKIEKSLKKAQDAKCFDKFVIFWVRRVPDPILFGVVNEEDKFYYIDEWDSDISIEDFLKYR